MKLALQLVLRDGAVYLPYLLDSLKRQSFRDWKLFVLDNGSVAEEWSTVQRLLADSGLPYETVREAVNTGFAPAHDRLFALHDAEFVQLLNQDAFLEPDFLEKLINHLAAHPGCAAVSGAIGRWDFDGRDAADGGRTDRADTLGIAMTWYGAVHDIGAGGPLPRVSEVATAWPVLGVSGCLPMYRRLALLEAGPWRTIFNPHYFAYKEDVDLSLRLETAGWTAATVPAARAYHRRTLGPARTLPWSAVARRLSYRNHLWVLATHWRPRDLLLRPGMPFYESAKAAMWLFKAPRAFFAVWRETWRARQRLRRERAFVRELRRTVRPADEEEPEADLAVVSVCYNELDDRYLASLASAIRTARRRIVPVIVDNASDRMQVEALVWSKLPEAVVVLRDGNYGFGRSSNRGAAEVRASNYLMLNPDTAIIEPGTFDRLCDWLDTHPNCGLVAPRLVGEGGTTAETCRRYPKWYAPLTQRTSLGHTAWGRNYSDRFLMREYDRQAPREVDWVQGSAMCLPARVWDRLGGFDDRFWLYYEDIDLCRRVRLLGYDLTYLPQVAIMHAYGRASARIRNHLLNFLRSRATRGHIMSWMRYHLKWRCQPEPSADADARP